MRRRRLVMLLGLVGLVLIGAGWAVAAASSGSAHRPPGAPGPRPSAVAALPRASAQLMRQLRQYLSRGAPAIPPVLAIPRPVLPGGGTCFVAAGGSCSATPCIEFVHAPPVQVASAPFAVALPRSVSVQVTPAAVVGPPAPSCHAPPHVLRVSGP